MVNDRSRGTSVMGFLLAALIGALAGCSKPTSESSSKAVSTASAMSATAPVASASAGAPACKAGEIVAYKYDSAATPICGRPCKTDSDCSAEQECGFEAARSLETTGGMAAAKANAVMLCTPKPSAATCKEGEVFGWVSHNPNRGFCSRKCSVDADCLRGHVCVEGHTTKDGGDVVHMCIAKPVK